MGPKGFIWRRHPPFVRVRLALGALSNKHFDNSLFPLRTPHDEYLPRYAEALDALELAELYHAPDLSDRVQGWLDQAPRGFAFLPKLWKHAVNPQEKEQDLPWGDDALDAARESLEGMRPILDSDHVGPVIAQFPPRFTHTDDHLTWLDDMLDMEPSGTFAVEFRDPSWGDDAVRDFLIDRRTPLVWSTHPKAPDVDWATGDVGVVRLAGTHYPDAKTRGRPVQVADRLEDILALRAKLAQAPWKECFVSVLNPFEGNAVDSIPRVAAGLVDMELGRRLTRRPGEALFKDPPGGPKQSGLGAYG